MTATSHADSPAGRGRRRESSRHRTTRRLPLPDWLSWVLRSGTPLVSLVPALVAVVLVQSLSPAAQAVPTGTGRFALAGSWLATEPGALVGYGLWSSAPPFGWAELGLLLRLLQGGSAQSVLAAAHGAMLLITLLQVALVWLLARRVGVSGLGAGVVAAAFGVAPIAVQSHTAVSTAALAVVWLLVSAVLAQGGGRTVVLLLAGITGGLAVWTDPIALPGALAVAVSAAALRANAPARDAPERVTARRRLRAAGVVMIGLLAASVAVAVAARQLAGGPPSKASAALTAVGAAAAAPPVRGAAAAVQWLTADPLSLLLTLVALVLVATRRRGVLLLVLAVVLALASVWPIGLDPVTPIVAMLPIAALAIGGVIDRAIAALGSPAFWRTAVGSGWLMGVAALLVVSGIAWAGALGSLQRGSDQPVALAQQWVRESVPSGQVVLVDLAAWPDLSRLSKAEVAWYAGGARDGSVPSSAPWSDADYVVADAGLRHDATGAAARTLARSLSVAGFGTGRSGVDIRAVQETAATPAPTPAQPPTAAQRQAQAARVAAGAQLAQNPRITLAGADRAALLAGEVDGRIALVLAQFVTTHRVTVSGFPRVAGVTGDLRRQVLISAIDGHRIPADADRTGDLLRFLSGLRGDFSTARIDATDGGVLATFSDDPTWVPAS